MSIYNPPARYNTPVLQYPGRQRAYPLEGDSLHFTVSEKYIVRRSNYTRLPRTTVCGGYSTAFLCDQQIEREEGGLIWYNLLFSTVPADIIDYTNGSFIFPGIDNQRAPMPSRTALCKVVRRFYRIGAAGITTVESIPLTEQTSLVFNGQEIGFLLSGNTITIDSFTITTGTKPEATAGSLAVGGFLFDTGMSIVGALSGSGSGAATRYSSMISADAGTVTSYGVVVETSSPTRYLGDIWFTDTTYTKAQ